MTIPSLLSNVEDKVAVVELKKYSAEIQQVIKSAEAEEGSIEQWYSGTDHAEANLATAAIFKKYLKVTKDCGTTDSECQDENYSYLPKSVRFSLSLIGYHELQLVNGAYIYLYSNQPLSISLYIDVNGAKKPNKLGYDLFYFQAYSETYTKSNNLGLKPQILIPEGFDIYSSDNFLSENCNPNGIAARSNGGENCTAWAYYNGNRDYLHQ